MSNQLSVRRAFVASGQVQGVGFRPFVYRLAAEGGLTGTVGNTSEGVRMELQGPTAEVQRFGRRLRAELPPLARLTGVVEHDLPTVEGETAFRIVSSSGEAGHSVLVSPDMSVCADCLADMRDPANPRYNYAFTNCTNCGPRYTITRSIPYDRAVTSMSCFPLCPQCAAEYANPADRRFHAQPVACPVCGPRLWFVDAAARAAHTAPTDDNMRTALEKAVQTLLEGKILALKGLGGFQLACDARNAQSLQELRRRKNRPHKPLALMVGDIATARALCALAPEHEALLQSPEKPVVLCPRHMPEPAPCSPGWLPPEVAPDTGTVGIMLPYTPLHAVLFDRLAQRTPLPPVLVMTSANAGGEPICLGNREALNRLEHLADAWLLHDRDILVRVDDSVVTLQPRLPSAMPSTEDTADAAVPASPAGASLLSEPLFYRRARGYVPRPVFLPLAEQGGPCVMGTGAELKTTICLTRGREAFVGQHIGDLENPATLAFYEEVAAHLESLLEVRPRALVCDAHPDFLSTRYAEARAQREGIPLWHLQHHAAHAAAVLAENSHYAPALALCLDGTGLGDDGTVWGGELLFMALEEPRWQRLGRLAPFALPGGDAATRQPWRIAQALHALCEQEGQPLPPRYPWLHPSLPQHAQASAAVAEMLRRNINCPTTSSCGRLFDAVAAQLGLCQNTTYEGQAAIRLEDAASKTTDSVRDALDGKARNKIAAQLVWPVGIANRQGLLEMDSAGLFAHAVRAQAQGMETGEVAARFHLSLARALAAMAGRAARKLGVSSVGLSGGVMQNATLARLLPLALAEQGLAALTHHELPPGDGGLSLGQAVWGRRMLAAGKD